MASATRSKYTLSRYVGRNKIINTSCKLIFVIPVANLLGNFSVALTYDLFITLGLITAVPVSAGKIILLKKTQKALMRNTSTILI